MPTSACYNLNMKNGLFVTFEGLDGTGKTTQISKTHSFLENAGKSVLCVREPGGTDISEKIRNIILDRDSVGMCPETEMLLYAASRAQLVGEKILPALRDGKIVLCDRYLDSNLAYQGWGRGIKIEDILSVNMVGTGGLMPDLTFLFNIGLSLGFDRLKKSREIDRMESESTVFFTKVYEGYQSIMAMYPQRIHEVTCTGNEDEVFNCIRPVIEKFI